MSIDQPFVAIVGSGRSRWALFISIIQKYND